MTWHGQLQYETFPFLNIQDIYFDYYRLHYLGLDNIKYFNHKIIMKNK